MIVPLSTLKNWMKELEKWGPSLKAVSISDNKADIEVLTRGHMVSADWDVCETTAKTAIQEKVALNKIFWRYLILDYQCQPTKKEQSFF